MIVLSIVLMLAAAFCLVWAMNLSFAAHLDTKDMKIYHIASFMVALAAVVCLTFSILIL